MNPNILYEDEHIIVCIKPAGTPTQSAKVQVPDMVSIVKKHIFMTKTTKKEPYLALIHRLDQPVEGILVFGKTPAAAKILTKQLQRDEFQKHYLALLCACPEPHEGNLEHYLVKDGRDNTSKVCSSDTHDAKKASLEYSVLSVDASGNTLTAIKLHTGRHHQIRVQMAFIGCGIVGDRKYNSGFVCERNHPLALCAQKLEFQHPISQKKLTFKYLPEFAKDTHCT